MPAPTAKRPPKVNPFTGRDVPWLLDAQTDLYPDKDFIVWEPFDADPQSFSYADFAEETKRVAAGMMKLGVGQGDRVVIHLDNCPEFLIAWFACSRLGAVAVTTNTRSTLDELSYFISHSRASFAITQPRYAELVGDAGPALKWLACTASDCGERLSKPRLQNVLPFEDLRGDPSGMLKRAPDPMVPNNIQYTSGTTSRPKGVVWTHANVLWGATVNATHTRLTTRDVAIFYFPLFHANALCWTVLAILGAGGTAVMLPRFSSSRFWTIARRHGCTWANMVMFTLRALQNLEDPESHSFRLWTCAADLAFVRKRWGIKTVGWFGMTETISQPIVSDHDWLAPEGSMGRPSPEYEVAIRDDRGIDVDFGEVGDLWIRGIPGLSLFYEYLDDPEATAAAFDEEGWFATGDRAMPFADGNIRFQGRAKDMLKVGAENVGAQEIETVIQAVAGVVEVAVVGRQDPMLDEVPVAFVVATQPGDELRSAIVERCNERLSDFKRPREVRFVEELPKGLLDKVLKKELRAQLDLEQSGST